MKKYILYAVTFFLFWSCVISSYGQSLQSELGGTVEIIGHRGAAYLAPENTLASVLKAVELGADAVEVDIYLSKDNRIVVIHDATTNRTTNQNMVVAETTYAELSKLDAGSYKSPEYRGEKIPLLEDVLSHLPDNINIYIEVKESVRIIPYLKLLLDKHPRKLQFRIIAFDIETISEAKKQMASIPCYYLKSSLRESQYDSFVDELIKRGLDGADLNHSTITPRLVKKLKQAGLPCLAWTVNTEEEARSLIKMGVVGITTDKPGLLKNSL